MPTQRIRKNQLPTTLGQMEERLLYSLSTLETNVVSANQNVQQTPAPEPVNPNAPRVTRALSSANSGEIFGKSSFLRVRATDDKGASNLTYHWSVESSSNGENATFANNGTNSASSTHIGFRRAGTYNVRVDIVDSDGNRTSDQLTLNVRQRFTDFQVSTPTRLVHGNASLSVDSTEQTLQVVARDQFRQSMLDQPVAAFDFTATPEGAKPWIETQSNGLVNVRFDRAGRYQLTAAIGGQTRTVNLTVNSVPTSIRATIGGRVLSQDTINEVRTMTPEIQAVVVDQFGDTLNRSGFEWSIDGHPLSLGAELPAQSLNLRDNHASLLTITNGSLSATVLVKFSPEASPSVLVRNPEELAKAVADAKGGEEIILQSGVNFGILRFFRPAKRFEKEVIFRSSSSETPAYLTAAVFREASNISLKGISIVGDSRYANIRIESSNNIKIEDFRATANLDSFKVPESTIDGIQIRSSHNVTIANGLIHNVVTGLWAQNSSNIVIKQVTFQETLQDPINIGQNVTDIEISDSIFHAQKTVLFPNHHYDSIQFWANTNSQMNTKNVTIRGNTFLNIGEAVKPQSIFMRANYVDALGVQNPFRFENVLIEGNVIVAMHAHAISVTDVDGLTVRNNTLIFAGDFTIPPPQVTVPGISYGMADNVRVYDNIIPNRTNYPVSDTPEFYNNLIYSVANGEIVNILRNPFSTMPDRDSFATFANPEDSADGWRKLGALSVSQKSSTIPLFTSKMEIRNGKIEALLDARHSLPAKGKSLDGAQYEWIFEDGSSANGKLVSKSFVSAGTQSIELRITESDGTLTVLKKQGIFIPATSVLDLNFENPAEKSSPLGPAIAIGDFKKVVSNGNFVEVGGERGHIYLPPNDSNLSILTSTKELSVSLSIRAISEQNTSAIPLITKHGAWGLRLDAVRNTLQLATGSSRFSLRLPEVVASGDWVDLAFTWKEGGFEAYVNGKSAGRIKLSEEQFNQFFKAGGYGLGIGGSGPWVDTRNQVNFGLDNLQVHTVGLSADRVMEIRKSNLLTR